VSCILVAQTVEVRYIVTVLEVASGLHGKTGGEYVVHSF
jgi:hypothetical protein